jgi:hypothetical protein
MRVGAGIKRSLRPAQVLIDAVSELLGGLAEVWQAAFAPHFLPALFPAVLRYAAPARSPADRLMAIGAIAQVRVSLIHDITT